MSFDKTIYYIKYKPQMRYFPPYFWYKTKAFHNDISKKWKNIFFIIFLSFLLCDWVIGEMPINSVNTSCGIIIFHHYFCNNTSTGLPEPFLKNIVK